MGWVGQGGERKRVSKVRRTEGDTVGEELVGDDMGNGCWGGGGVTYGGTRYRL